MNNILINGESIDAQSKLYQAHDELIKVSGKTGEMQDAVAYWLCVNFSVPALGTDVSAYKLADYATSEGIALPWYDRTSGESAKPIKAYKEKLFNDLRALNFTDSNIYKIWQRMQEASGRVMKSAKKEEDKSVDTVTMKELATILRRIQKAEVSQDYAPKAIKALSTLESAYELMGGKLSDVYTSN
jgi:hypothetical protein